ncbi:hypothetical protein LTR53_015919 [Teratosphaeriaceae sp. CCFEE 6253]|nr:hypothetical protein LTR53_015919 [Teratosphaeriaceae sp. CCFEE 6253]
MADDYSQCTLTTCDISTSIFEYRPSLGANATFIVLFGISLGIHVYQGIRYRQPTFSTLMATGCLCEMIGYGARVQLYHDPWDFNTGFLMQIICITIAPVFMTAAIYVTLYKSVRALSPASAAFKPSLYYQIFIPCDVVSLALQAAGGALSTNSFGSNDTGVNIGLAGLSFQVVTLVIFILLAGQYALRYRRDAKKADVVVQRLNGRWKLFLSMLSLATLLIFIRCAYRIYELSNGYSGAAIHNQGEFIGLESIMIIVAVSALNVGHPGRVLVSHGKNPSESSASAEMGKEGDSGV